MFRSLKAASVADTTALCVIEITANEHSETGHFVLKNWSLKELLIDLTIYEHKITFSILDQHSRKSITQDISIFFWKLENSLEII